MYRASIEEKVFTTKKVNLSKIVKKTNNCLKMRIKINSASNPM